MVYKIDYVDGDVLTWSVTETGVCEVDESYTPTIYVSVHDDRDFSTARAALRDHPAVVRVAVVDERVSFRHDPEQVLRVDVVDLNAVNSVFYHGFPYILALAPQSRKSGFRPTFVVGRY